MESRTSRRLGSRPPPGARRGHGQGPDGDGVVRISGLHDDLLLLILTRLRCARTAARTSVLSHRWRGSLWRRLPELHFLDTLRRALEDALSQVTVPKVSLLHIVPDPSLCCRQRFSVTGIASLLHDAARLDPVDLKIAVWLEPRDRGIAVELPCFARAASINLDVPFLELKFPAHAGDFPVLEWLTVAGCLINISSLISRCPCLRFLELNLHPNRDVILVHSTTIEELIVTSSCRMGRIGVQGLDIVTPVLKKFTLSLSLGMHKDFAMSLLAPMLQNRSWNCSWFDCDVSIHEMWCLGHLKLDTEDSGCVILALKIRRPMHFVQHARNLQDIFHFPKCSVLELSPEKSGHVYGAMVLKLLRICNGIRRLKLSIDKKLGREEACPPNCSCDQPQSWRDQNIFLMGLEKVEIENFKAGGHEVDFLKLLFRCAPLTQVIMKLDSKVSATCRGCKEIYNVFKANPSVKCNIYHKRGKEVIYA